MSARVAGIHPQMPMMFGQSYWGTSNQASLGFGWVAPLLRQSRLQRESVISMPYGWCGFDPYYLIVPAQPTARHTLVRFHVILLHLWSCLGKGWLGLIHDRAPAFHCSMFLVEKASGRWRPIRDLLLLDTYLALSKIRVEAMASVLASFWEDFMFFMYLVLWSLSFS